jgi:raffinose/stachyose/melibiose transport system permease protein
VRKNIVYPLYFTVGALVLYVFIFVIPALIGLAYSFTDWNSYTNEINFVGLDNFAQIFSSSSNYLSYIRNTLIFAGMTIVLKTVFGLGMALLLHNGVKHFSSIYRVIAFLPAVLPMVVIGIVFKSILDPRDGILNEFLRSIGLRSMTQPWLVSPNTALLSVIGVDTWKGVGYIMVILLAGLQTIPTEYYEAAQMDGANAFDRLRHITIPLLMPAIIVSTVLNVLHALKVFDIVYVLTNGGPGYATEVVYTSIFKEFSRGRYGVGTAISSIMFMVMSVVGFLVIRAMSRRPVYD